MRLAMLALVAAWAMLFPIAVSAGTTGGITGSIVNAGSGAPIAGAKVTASSATDIQTTHTDARGRFAFVSLTPGTYAVAVDREGFEPATVRDVAVLADAMHPLKIAMKSAVIAIVLIDGPFTFYGLGMGVGAGRIADVYTQSAYRTAPASAPPIANLTFIRLTPGITFGAGAPMMH